jgi:hypothetical protein
MCSIFLETVSFHQAKAMTAINVNRSLITRSIINSFLKAIVLMCLITTSGSFVGDPSGPRRGLLVLKNDHRFKNKMMVAATPQVVQPSLVLSMPTTDTAQTKKMIIGYHDVEEEKKFNLEDRLEEEEEEGDLVPPFYVNITLSNDFVTWEDAFLVAGRPVLKNFNKNILLDIEDFSKPPPFAEDLDRIAAELFLGGERFAKWIDDFVVTLVWTVHQVCSMICPPSFLNSTCNYI